jgi:hypothetical protein
MKGLSIKSLVAVAALAVLALGIGLISQGTAKAQEDPQVPTNAVVGTSGNPPNIECKWELPDMDSNAAGIQYTKSPGHVHDDDMSVVPDADNNSSNGIQVPCSGPPASDPSMPGGVKHMIQVNPNLEDQADADPALEYRDIQLWTAVDSPLGVGSIIDVYWDIYHPDGTKKFQIHAIGPNADPLTAGRVSAEDNNCTDMGSGASGSDGDMFEAAVHTGQMTAAAADDENLGMIAKCEQSGKALYYAQFPLSKDQMCGEYQIVLTVTSVGGTDTMTNYIDVPCIFGIRIDFNKVDWADISPGVTDWVNGNLIWDQPKDNAPTVKNVGNDGMGLKLKFSKMVGILKGEITSFDAKFGRSPSTLQTIEPITATIPVEFDSNPARILCANEIGKLDLSIHPPSPLTPDTYTGTLNVVGVARPNECLGDAHK